MSSRQRSRSPRRQPPGDGNRMTCNPEMLTDESKRNPDILAYGEFKAGVDIYHGEWTTKDHDSKGSHLRTLKIIFTGSEEATLNCFIEGCTTTASVGAHVYYTPKLDASASVCFIIPTCSAHNNVHRVWRAEQTHSQAGAGGEGVKVKAGTPFTVRNVKDTAMGIKGSHGKGGGKGASGFPEQTGLCDAVSEFKFYQSQAGALCKAGLLANGKGRYQLP